MVNVCHPEETAPAAVSDVTRLRQAWDSGDDAGGGCACRSHQGVCPARRLLCCLLVNFGAFNRGETAPSGDKDHPIKEQRCRVSTARDFHRPGCAERVGDRVVDFCSRVVSASYEHRVIREQGRSVFKPRRFQYSHAIRNDVMGSHAISGLLSRSSPRASPYSA